MADNLSLLLFNENTKNTASKIFNKRKRLFFFAFAMGYSCYLICHYIIQNWHFSSSVSVHIAMRYTEPAD